MTATGLKRFVPRFSLRTLVVFMVLVTSLMALWSRSGNWQKITVGGGSKPRGGFTGPYNMQRMEMPGARVVAGGGDLDGIARIIDSLEGVRAGTWGKTLEVLYHDKRVAMSDVPKQLVRGYEWCEPVHVSERTVVVFTELDDSLECHVWLRRFYHIPVYKQCEFWFAVLFLWLLVWSILRDRRRLRAEGAPSRG